MGESQERPVEPTGDGQSLRVALARAQGRASERSRFSGTEGGENEVAVGFRTGRVIRRPGAKKKKVQSERLVVERLVEATGAIRVHEPRSEGPEKRNGSSRSAGTREL
jgi:hypothetical protein